MSTDSSRPGLPVVMVSLDHATLDKLADLVAERLAPLVSTSTANVDVWMGTREAAEYLGLTVAALHRHTAARTISFVQDAPGGRCWFKRQDLDQWREQGRRG